MSASTRYADDELREHASRVIDDHRLAANHPIAVLAPNGLGAVVGRVIANELGTPLVPINPSLQADEIRHILADSRAGGLLAHPRLLSAARAALSSLAGPGPELIELEGELGASNATIVVAGNRRLRPADIGSTIIYTSGTTGTPKGCLRSAEQECARATELITTYSISSDDVQLIASPLAHSAPGIFLRAGSAAGCRSVILPRFDAMSFWAALQEQRGSFFFLVPTQYHRLLGALGDLPVPDSVRAALVAGAPLSRRTRHELHRWFGPGRLWEFYGSSETGTVSVLPPDLAARGAGSVGRLAPGVDIDIRDDAGASVAPGQVGEIFVRSPTVMSGYLPLDAPRDPGGFLSVGDIGYLDDEGFLFLVDRKFDTIISGGVNVYPAEVEATLVEDPQVAAAVVFGVDDEDWGQRVVAMVATTSPTTGETLRRHCREHLAGYKVPKEILLVDAAEIPIGGSGKPQRRRARALYLSRQTETP